MSSKDDEIEFLRRALAECRYQLAIMVKMLAQAINELREARKRE